MAKTEHPDRLRVFLVVRGSHDDNRAGWTISVHLSQARAARRAEAAMRLHRMKTGQTFTAKGGGCWQSDSSLRGKGEGLDFYAVRESVLIA